MKITRVIIGNWRSVKYADFEPADMSVLVGANNAGKTNILSAINFLIGDRWPMPGNFSTAIFIFATGDARFYIQLDFEGAAYSRLDFDTRASAIYLQAYDALADTRCAAVSTTRNEQTRLCVCRCRPELRPAVWRLALDLFGQAVRILHDDLLTRRRPIAGLRKLLDQAHGLLKTDLYTTFESACARRSPRNCARRAMTCSSSSARIDETNLYREPLSHADRRGAAKSPGEAGSGVRNLLVLALFHAFAMPSRAARSLASRSRSFSCIRTRSAA